MFYVVKIGNSFFLWFQEGEFIEYNKIQLMQLFKTLTLSEKSEYWVLLLGLCPMKPKFMIEPH